MYVWVALPVCVCIPLGGSMVVAHRCDAHELFGSRMGVWVCVGCVPIPAAAGVVMMWDVSHRRLVATLTSSSDACINSVDVSADMAFLVAGYQDGTCTGGKGLLRLTVLAEWASWS